MVISLWKLCFLRCVILMIIKLVFYISKIDIIFIRMMLIILILTFFYNKFLTTLFAVPYLFKDVWNTTSLFLIFYISIYFSIVFFLFIFFLYFIQPIQYFINQFFSWLTILFFCNIRILFIILIYKISILITSFVSIIYRSNFFLINIFFLNTNCVFIFLWLLVLMNNLNWIFCSFLEEIICLMIFIRIHIL